MAEPIFLSRQYARCANCHYSPTGGGLLTPYGRSLSREELSTFGKSSGTPQGREHEFLYGAAGGALGPLSLGVDLRPSHLDIDLGRGISTTRDILMNAELVAALRRGGFTFYAELGRQPRGDDPRVASLRALDRLRERAGVRGAASAASCPPTASASPTTRPSRARRWASTTRTRSTRSS